MRALLMLIALIAPIAANAAATDAEAESCEQVRARIGVAPLADHDLLRTLALRQECKFTAAEVYRAAYGDKPLPQEHHAQRQQRRRHDDHDDD